jgi:nickel transport protein
VNVRALAMLAILLAAPAEAHEVVHSVERGRAVAVRVRYADGQALAYAEYEVFSPADAKIPHAKGRTDRSGWLAFVPDATGAWRVKVADGGGHGLDTAVDVPDAAAAGAAPDSGSAPSALGFALRPVVGLAAIALVFAVLYAVQRRRKERRA